MKYIVAAIFLIGTALSFPLGDNDESKSVPVNSISPVKSQESGEVQKHDEKDVSHEHHKDHHDSSEASEESSESHEKPEQQSNPEPAPEESKPSEEKILDEPAKKIDPEPEKSIDILEAASKPAAIAAEPAAPEEQFVKNIEEEPEKKSHDKPHSDPIQEVKHAAEGHENSVAAEVDIPKDKVDEPLPEGKSDLLDMPIDMKKEELKIEKPAEEMKLPIAEMNEKNEAPAENEAKKLPEPEPEKPEEVSHSPSNN